MTRWRSSTDRARCGFPRLDESARDTVRRWRFVPAKRGDTPIEGWVSFPVEFNLES